MNVLDSTFEKIFPKAAELMHYGMKYKSGRYPYGSGENPFQHDPGYSDGQPGSLTKIVDKLREEGATDADICLLAGFKNSKELQTKYRKDKYAQMRDKWDNDPDNPFVTDAAYRSNTPGSFTKIVKDLKSQGYSELTIAEMAGLGTARAVRANLRADGIAEKNAIVNSAVDLIKSGKSLNAAANELGINESTLRGMLKNDSTSSKAQAFNNTIDIIRQSADNNRYVDVGKGTNLIIGVSNEAKDAAVQVLVNEGYKRYSVKYDLLGVKGKQSSMQVLCAPDVTYPELMANRDKIQLVTEVYTNDNGRTIYGIKSPTSVDSSRIYVRYAEDGGKAKDGVIEIRPNVEDLSLGNSTYAQVRIGVDGTHYLKGMAMYSDEIPEGYDILVNSNKKSGTPLNKVFKEMKTDPKTGEIDQANPFGSAIKMKDGYVVGQHEYVDSKTGETKLSPINIVREEGDWDTWSNELASQFLSKQYPSLAKKQLNIKYENLKSEFDEINSLTNGTVKKQLLEEFANECDSEAVHLKAAAISGQTQKVILPLTQIGENEIYAPTYENGEKVALIRYPHGGIFEIPVLTVNNENEQGNKFIGKNVVDAVGISTKAAQQLSGADFDGDSVVVIPLKNTNIRASEPLAGLKDFDTNEYEGEKEVDENGKETGYAYNLETGKRFKLMKKDYQQKQMGMTTNLITDMTIKDAPEEDIVKAVKHSMVVIDAVKHNLDYRLSEQENDIAELKKKYQGGTIDGKSGGASTLISLAKNETSISKQTVITSKSQMTEEELERYNNGEVIKRDKPEYYTNKKTGDMMESLDKVPRMTTVSDAYELSSGTVMEGIFADHANKLKALANEARKEYRTTEEVTVNKAAKEQYAEEVASLNSKLKVALANRPYERLAQVYANVKVDELKADNPEMGEDELGKYKNMTLQAARARVGANKKAAMINITDEEWEAIQAGAVSKTALNNILQNADADRVRSLATPRDEKEVSASVQARIRNLYATGNYTLEEIATELGLSTSTIDKYATGRGE